MNRKPGSPLAIAKQSLLRPFLILFVAVISASLSGCIATYRPEKVDLEPALKKEGIIHFFYYAGGTPDPKAQSTALPKEFQIVQRLLEEQAGFAAAIVSSTAPAKGLYVTVYRTVKESSRGAQAFCFLSFITIAVLPCYAEQESAVRMNFYLDNELKKGCEYPMEERYVQWIGLLPVIWINGAMTQYRQSFEAIIYQSIRDAKADGHL